MGIPVKGLSSLLKSVKVLCKALNVFAPLVRPFVPEANRSTFDTRVAQVHEACSLLLNLEWLDDNPATTNALAK